MIRDYRAVALSALALILTVAGMWYVVYTRVISPPEPFEFVTTSISPHEVASGGHLTMTATADLFAAPECYNGSQRVLRFSDHSEARVPGERRTLGSGIRQTILYEMDVPDNAPSGPATLTVRELFTCGAHPVESPTIAFMIRGNVEPGIDQHYNGRRGE